MFLLSLKKELDYILNKWNLMFCFFVSCKTATIWKQVFFVVVFCFVWSVYTKTENWSEKSQKTFKGVKVGGCDHVVTAAKRGPNWRGIFFATTPPRPRRLSPFRLRLKPESRREYGSACSQLLEPVSSKTCAQILKYT